jgi:5-methylcytosine-specific restriction protein A
MMPLKPKRPCSYPGCPNLTAERFCEEHAKKESQRYERYDRDPDKKKRYDRSWRRIRDQHLAEHPLCEQCEKVGKITPAREVHHIKPLSQGGTHDPSNLMGLCTPCHSEITAREGGRWGRR